MKKCDTYPMKRWLPLNLALLASALLVPFLSETLYTLVSRYGLQGGGPMSDRISFGLSLGLGGLCILLVRMRLLVRGCIALVYLPVMIHLLWLYDITLVGLITGFWL